MLSLVPSETLMMLAFVIMLSIVASIYTVPAVCPTYVEADMFDISSAFLVTLVVVVGIYDEAFSPSSNCAPHSKIDVSSLSLFRSKSISKLPSVPSVVNVTEARYQLFG